MSSEIYYNYSMLQRKSHHKGFKRSKKVDEWNKVRAELKKEFEALGIVQCEMCGTSDFLSFAHRVKRRKITTPEELRMVALLCMDSPRGQGCHNKLEFSPPDVMYDTISLIISNRRSTLEQW